MVSVSPATLPPMLFAVGNTGVSANCFLTVFKQRLGLLFRQRRSHGPILHRQTAAGRVIFVGTVEISNTVSGKEFAFSESFSIDSSDA